MSKTQFPSPKTLPSGTQTIIKATFAKWAHKRKQPMKTRNYESILKRAIRIKDSFRGGAALRTLDPHQSSDISNLPRLLLFYLIQENSLNICSQPNDVQNKSGNNKVCNGLLGEMESVSNKPAKDINLIKENPPSPIRRGSTRVTDY